MNRKLIIGLVAVAACAALIEWSSCGSSSSATPTPDPPTPGDTTVSSVAITGGNAKAIPTEGVIASDGTTTNVSTGTTAFTVTFSAAMDVTTVTSTNITLECPVGTAQTLGTIAATDSTNTAFTIATTAALPEKTICTATFGTGLTDATNHSLSAAVTSTFTTGCSTSDSFASTTTITADTGCWSTMGDGFTSTISDATSGMVDTLTKDPDQGENIGSYKSFANGSATASVTITNMPSTGSPVCGIFYANQALTSNLSLLVSYDSDPPAYKVFPVAGNDTIGTEVILTTAPSASTPLTLTITAGASNYSISCSQSGTDCGSLAITNPQQPIFTEAIYIGVFIGGDTGASCTYGDGTASNGFIVTGASATEPNPTGTTGGQD